MNLANNIAINWTATLALTRKNPFGPEAKKKKHLFHLHYVHAESFKAAAALIS